MSIINEWRGDAEATVQQGAVQVHQAVPGSLYQIVLASVATLSVRATISDTRQTIASQLASRFGAVPNVTVNYTAGSDEFTFEGRVAGTPIADQISGSNPASSYVERVRAGVLPTEQEFLIALPETTAGGTWTLTANFGGSDETTAGIAWNATAGAVRTALGNLTTPAATDFVVSLEQTSPRTYRVRVTGDYAGVPITLTADGSGLTGNATAIVTRSQSVGGDAPAVWLFTSQGTETGDVTVTIGGTVYNAMRNEILDASWWTARLPVAPTFIHAEGFVDYLDIMWGGGVIALPSSVQIQVTGGWIPAQQLQEYQGSTNHEFQLLANGNGTVTWNGHTSAGFGATWQVPTLMESLTGVEPGDIEGWDVYGSASHVSFSVYRFQGNLGNSDQPLITHNNAGQGPATQIVNGSGPGNDIHSVQIIGATGGTYTLQVPGKAATGNIAYLTDDADDIDTAIEATLAAGETVSVSGPHIQYLIEYTGDLAETTIPLIVADTSSLTGGTVSVSIAVVAVPGVNEQQMIFIDPHASDGVYLLGFRGQLTGDLNHDEGVANVETALEAIITIGAGNVILDGTESQMLVEFLDDLGQQPVELLTINQDNLIVSGASAMTVTVTQFASGPNHWNNPANWTLNHVPRSSETAVLGSGRVDIAYGLVQAAPCTFSGTDLICSKLAHFVDGQTVRLRTTDALPTAEDSGGPITLNGTTSYYVVAIDVRDGVQVLKISLTDNGEPITFTNAGTGTHRVSVQLAALHHYSLYTGKVGWPRRNSSGHWVDRERYLQIDFLDPTGGEPNLEIGIGRGNSTTQFLLDAGPSHLDGRVIKSAAANIGAAIHLLNNNLADSELLLVGGSTAMATEAGESAAVKRIIAFEAARLLLGTVDFERLENYGDQVDFTSGTASGSVVQMRNR